MEIINEEDINIQEVVKELRKGKTIVYPTETTYGLGCDAGNQEAIDKVFKIKKRQKLKPMLVIIADVSMMMRYVDWTPSLDKIAQDYWPGALTVVAKLKDNVNFPSGVVAKDNTVAFRVSNHPFASELSKWLDGPIVSTSANITSEESPCDIESVVDHFAESKDQPDIVVDSGELPHKSSSTIIRVDGKEMEVLRQGDVVINNI